jgi:SAM-dependent methyltransferase
MNSLRVAMVKVFYAFLGWVIWLIDEGPQQLKAALYHGRDQKKRILGKQQSVEKKGQSLVRGDVELYRYQTLQFSFWRSIEHNMLKSSTRQLSPPVLDIGCGDGVYANDCLIRVDYGVDLDLSALARLKFLGFPQYVTVADASLGIPLPAHSIGSVFSNSVIEHVPALPDLLDEVARILRPGGTFMFTVPGEKFKDYLAQFTGLRDVAWQNRQMGHINLYSGPEWCEILLQHGFRVQNIEYYLSPGGIRIWRVLSSRTVQLLERSAGNILWSFCGEWLLSNVAKSLHLSTEGAGIIVVAVRN